MLIDIAELLLPRSCVGCLAPGEVLCNSCRRLWAQPPQLISLRVDPGVPVWSCGAYVGQRRMTILRMKERGRRDVQPYMGAVVACALGYLLDAGRLRAPMVLVPAPTTRRAARVRGGDVVTRICGYSGADFYPVLYTTAGAADSVGLRAEQREFRLLGRLRLRPRIVAKLQGPVILLDDIATTGSTLRAAVSLLEAQNISVQAALVLAHA